MKPSLLDPAQNSSRLIRCADNIAGDVERCVVVYVSMSALIFSGYRAPRFVCSWQCSSRNFLATQLYV